MISIERTKELFASLNLTDQEAEEIRDITQLLTEVAYDDWWGKRKTKQNENKKGK